MSDEAIHDLADVSTSEERYTGRLRWFVPRYKDYPTGLNVADKRLEQEVYIKTYYADGRIDASIKWVPIDLHIAPVPDED